LHAVVDGICWEWFDTILRELMLALDGALTPEPVFQ
jgi:hypothetical protein